MIGCGIVLAVLAIILLTALITAWSIKRQIDPGPMDPTVLNPAEEQVLDQKVERVKGDRDTSAVPADRLIEFTEKELNALIGRNTDLSDKVKVDLEPDQIFARMNIPVPEDAPFLGGKTLGTTLRLTCSFKEDQPELILRKITLGGISIPNAWTGNRKNINLFGEAADSHPELGAFLDGIESFSIERDRVKITLKE